MFDNKATAEDLLACAAEAAPRAVYHPEAEETPETITIPAASLRRVGPGFANPFPSVIGADIFANYKPGDLLLGEYKSLPASAEL